MALGFFPASVGVAFAAAAFDRQERIERRHLWFSSDLIRRQWVLVLGVGGNGTHVALALVSIGVHRVTIVGKDVVEPSNLTRQVLYTPSQVGQPKTEPAALSWRARCLTTVVKPLQCDVLEQREAIAAEIKQADFVFCLVDHSAVRLLVASMCYRFKKPYAAGGIFTSSGLATKAVGYGPTGRPCLHCYQFGEPPPAPWVTYYSQRPTPAPGPDRSEILQFDDKLASLITSATSTYVAAALGSSFVVTMLMSFAPKLAFDPRVLPRLTWSAHRFGASSEPDQHIWGKAMLIHWVCRHPFPNEVLVSLVTGEADSATVKTRRQDRAVCGGPVE